MGDDAQVTLIAYQDPAHRGNSAEYHTGKPCMEKGCKEPAGTAWGKFWCFKHNVARMDRISANLEGMARKAEFSEAVQKAIEQERRMLLDAYATQHALIIAAGGKITVLPEHWKAKVTYQGTHSPKGKNGPMVFEIGTS